MYRFPNDFDSTCLTNTAIVQMCFAANVLTLHLANDIRIDVSGEFYYSDQRGSVTLHDFPVRTSSIMAVLEKQIVSAIASPSHDLELVFSSEERICLINDPQYESFTLSMSDREIII